ncbi:hypothetical protein [Novosphingobium sp. P6W]|uniref:hypothetical protein n=1 Tax=Novosphingobium sp. P6W TaxID=1609758 RepID=UPI0005C327B5|nr:hypothetical protein [Novosphingobium sp. P6W]AXB79043.1 hypothetical protein TQ38_021050 [Novosphingobium sp. P6W]KIS30707.1 hypothetical protein TQ38_20855 [Novosphingobium sp. P6W]
MTIRPGAGKGALGDDPHLIEVGIGTPLAKKRALKPKDPVTMPSDLLEQATRAAGMFQRSALGYLDHSDCRARLEVDAMSIVEIMAAMGFISKTGQLTKRGNSDDAE